VPFSGGRPHSRQGRGQHCARSSLPVFGFSRCRNVTFFNRLACGLLDPDVGAWGQSLQFRKCGRYYAVSDATSSGTYLVLSAERAKSDSRRYPWDTLRLQILKWPGCVGIPCADAQAAALIARMTRGERVEPELCGGRRHDRNTVARLRAHQRQLQLRNRRSAWSTGPLSGCTEYGVGRAGRAIRDRAGTSQTQAIADLKFREGRRAF
jgi:hypothetical protein